MVRAHGVAKTQKLHLIIGSYFALVHQDRTPALSLILLAQNRNGYGNLCELITHGRTRAEKGRYLLAPQDLDAPTGNIAHLKGLPYCLAILVPKYGESVERLTEQAAWMAATFPGRTWIAMTLLHHSSDERHRSLLEAVAGNLGLPVVATGDVCMHVRSRKPLQDTLTAIRLAKPITECRFDMAPNAEQHLRARVRLANL